MTLAIGCVGIMSSSMDNVTAKAVGKEIQAESSGTGIFHLSVPSVTTLELQAINELKAQCKGDVKNVVTRLQMRDFFFIAQSYTVKASGICVEG